ncbi:MAG: hypothetical protein N838_27810 [Thiohalocapsa sp. PB-PSB1]|jgi:hypothetical protein|nr:MAG: hypothetical protein N838_27810 [Thiohalocapsa sp. PB-PSB1]
MASQARNDRELPTGIDCTPDLMQIDDELNIETRRLK